ncbi:MAG: alpha-ribazole phosphatase [Firmicutes bacterium]|nr:alpha-ribazole phosphatase [Bacillota bacterium]
MTRVLLVRHGQTVWNHDARYQGHTDIELSEVGLKQARLLAQRLAREPVQAVYASDLKRAYETARILAIPHQLEVQTISSLREINFGAWEGLTFEEIKTRFKELADRWYTTPAEIQIPQGETFAQLKERAYRTVLELVKKHDPGAFIIVTHGGTIRAIICALLDIDLNHAFRIRQDNGALNIIEYHQNRGILCLLNDTHHLCSLS